MIFVASFAFAIVTGYLLIRSFYPQQKSAAAVLFLGACGAAVGLGIDSLLFFCFTAAGVARVAPLAIAQALLLAAALWLYHRKRPSRAARSSLRISKPALLAVIAFTAEFALALASFFQISRVDPQGEWDAWSIWNLRARYLYGGENSWHYAVSKYIVLQHPDYPLLTSSIIAHAWRYTGSMDSSIPIAAALLFMLATIVVLVAGLALQRGLTIGVCAGALLLAVPGWVPLAASQYADVPVSLYFLCTIALLCASQTDRRLALLAGVTASFSAWTKDEGLLFTVICLAIALIFYGWRRAALMLAGALPVLLFLIWFKLRVGPGVDPTWRQGGAVIAAKLVDPGRYWQTASAYGRNAAALPQLLLLPLFSVALGFKLNRAAFASLAITGLMFAGYFFFYLVTPYALDWQLSTSLGRLFLQLLPGLLFGWSTVAFSGQPLRGRVHQQRTQ